MFNALLLVYVVNAGTTQQFIMQEFPSMADCKHVKTRLSVHTDSWKDSSDQVIPNNFSAECIQMGKPWPDNLSVKDRTVKKQATPIPFGWDTSK
jgi:hypothetical protein